jgi:hypothetical protein
MRTLNIGSSVGPGAETVTNEKGARQSKVDFRFDLIPPGALFAVAEILAVGAEKYEVENWRGITDPGEHLNHALIHSYAYLWGDDAEGTPLEHLARAFCRTAFALEQEVLRLKAGGSPRPKMAYMSEDLDPGQIAGYQKILGRTIAAENPHGELGLSDGDIEDAADRLLRAMRVPSNKSVEPLSGDLRPTETSSPGDLHHSKVDLHVLTVLRDAEQLTAREIADGINSGRGFPIKTGAKEVRVSLKRLCNEGHVDRVGTSKWRLSESFRRSTAGPDVEPMLFGYTTPGDGSKLQAGVWTQVGEDGKPKTDLDKATVDRMKVLAKAEEFTLGFLEKHPRKTYTMTELLAASKFEGQKRSFVDMLAALVDGEFITKKGRRYSRKRKTAKRKVSKKGVKFAVSRKRVAAIEAKAKKAVAKKKRPARKKRSTKGRIEYYNPKTGRWVKS